MLGVSLRRSHVTVLDVDSCNLIHFRPMRCFLAPGKLLEVFMVRDLGHLGFKALVRFFAAIFSYVLAVHPKLRHSFLSYHAGFNQIL